MTTIDAMTAAGATSGPMGGAAESALGGLGGDAFLQLLVTQMRFQNPMDPSDPSDLMLQTAQLTQLENVQQLVALQRRDLGMQEATMAAGLLGSEVTGDGPEGAISGVVDAVRYTAAGPVLEVGGTELAMSDVTEVRQPSPPPGQTSEA